MDYRELINELGDGGTVVIGETDEDGLFVVGGIEIHLDKVMVGVGTGEGDDFSAPLSLADVRKAHALLGAYLAIVDAKQD